MKNRTNNKDVIWTFIHKQPQIEGRTEAIFLLIQKTSASALLVWIFQEAIIILSLKYPSDSFTSLCVHVEMTILQPKC